MNPIIDYVEHRLVWGQFFVLIGWIGEMLLFLSLVGLLIYRILNIH